jgi:hypothetical protein
MSVHLREVQGIEDVASNAPADHHAPTCHYESGIRAVKPELLESIAAALGVSINALKDYGVETAGELMSLLVRLEDSFGIVAAVSFSMLFLLGCRRHRMRCSCQTAQRFASWIPPPDQYVFVDGALGHSVPPLLTV